MTTAWHVDEDEDEVPKPWAWFDKDDVIDIPIDWSDWLTDKGTTYSLHTVIPDAGLVCVQSSQLAGVVTVRISKDPSGDDLVNGRKYGFTVRMQGANGEIQDRTFFLKVAVT